MKNIKRLFWTALGVLMVVGVLTGCSTHYTVSEAEQYPYAVIEVKNAGFDVGEFTYVDPEGHQQPLNNCGHPDFFSQRYCRTDDGLIVFTYSTSKSSIVNAHITIDGVKHDLSCATRADDFWSGLENCVPTN